MKLNPQWQRRKFNVVGSQKLHYSQTLKKTCDSNSRQTCTREICPGKREIRSSAIFELLTNDTSVSLLMFHCCVRQKTKSKVAEIWTLTMALIKLNIAKYPRCTASCLTE